jgi:heme/copper-type cytochrome/quinol oxidase subunit 3
MLNTGLLVTSGCSLTWAQYAMRSGDRLDVLRAFLVTTSLGSIFLACQAYEYCTLPFTISSGVYGSIFFLTTGFHGLHVILGLVMLFVCFWRHAIYHLRRFRHLGLDLSA